MTLGYDPVQKRFVGTFIGSMMTHMWIYNGTLDAAGKVLTLDTEGPGLLRRPGDGPSIRTSSNSSTTTIARSEVCSSCRDYTGRQSWTVERSSTIAHYRREN